MTITGATDVIPTLGATELVSIRAPHAGGDLVIYEAAAWFADHASSVVTKSCHPSQSKGRSAEKAARSIPGMASRRSTMSSVKALRRASAVSCRLQNGGGPRSVSTFVPSKPGEPFVREKGGRAQ